jgi:ABC-type bacteriocin/lantibiotic exporter with double-glycine peptidase domain
MMHVLILILSMLPGDRGGGLSSDDLDEHIAADKRARKTCGPVSVWYCIRRFGREVPPEQIVDSAGIEAGGVTLQQLLDLCLENELPAKGISGSKRDLAELPVPAILVIGSRHAVVYEGIDAETGHIRFFEPTYGLMKTAPMAEALELWTGEAIVFEDPRPSGFLLTSLAISTACTILLLGWFVSRMKRKPFAP